LALRYAIGRTKLAINPPLLQPNSEIMLYTTKLNHNLHFQPDQQGNQTISITAGNRDELIHQCSSLIGTEVEVREKALQVVEKGMECTISLGGTTTCPNLPDDSGAEALMLMFRVSQRASGCRVVSRRPRLTDPLVRTWLQEWADSLNNGDRTDEAILLGAKIIILCVI
jgi:hypothetical protein